MKGLKMNQILEQNKVYNIYLNRTYKCNKTFYKNVKYIGNYTDDREYKYHIFQEKNGNLLNLEDDTFNVDDSKNPTFTVKNLIDKLKTFDENMLISISLDSGNGCQLNSINGKPLQFDIENDTLVISANYEYIQAMEY